MEPANTFTKDIIRLHIPPHHHHQRLQTRQHQKNVNINTCSTCRPVPISLFIIYGCSHSLHINHQRRILLPHASPVIFLRKIHNVYQDVPCNLLDDSSHQKELTGIPSILRRMCHRGHILPNYQI
ncbi:MAG: hypothetical protein AAGG81_06860, partial [Chlamydiota bacterium]